MKRDADEAQREQVPGDAGHEQPPTDTEGPAISVTIIVGRITGPRLAAEAITAQLKLSG